MGEYGRSPAASAVHAARGPAEFTVARIDPSRSGSNRPAAGRRHSACRFALIYPFASQAAFIDETISRGCYGPPASHDRLSHRARHRWLRVRGTQAAGVAFRGDAHGGRTRRCNGRAPPHTDHAHGPRDGHRRRLCRPLPPDSRGYRGSRAVGLQHAPESARPAVDHVVRAVRADVRDADRHRLSRAL